MIILYDEFVKWYLETYCEPKGKSGPSDQFIVFMSKSSVAKEQSGELRFHPTLWPTAINDEIARGVYARTGLAENVDQLVCQGGRSLIGTQTEEW